MRLPRSKRYHAWEGETPLVDVVIQFVTVVAVFIGSYAVIFSVIAIRDGDPGLVLQYCAFLAAGGLAVVGARMFRRWRRHNC